MIVHNSPERVHTQQVVLFPFDDYSLPFHHSVRVARWQRDRLGYFQASDVRLRSAQPRHVVSAPIDLEGAASSVALNVEGLSEYTQVEAEILDGFAASDCEALKSGLCQSVHWRGGDRLAVNGPIRVRLNLVGIRP